MIYQDSIDDLSRSTCPLVDPISIYRVSWIDGWMKRTDIFNYNYNLSFSLPPSLSLSPSLSLCTDEDAFNIYIYMQYNIQNDACNDFFVVNEVTGVIYLNGPLNRKLQDIDEIIEATDSVQRQQLNCIQSYPQLHPLVNLLLYVVVNWRVSLSPVSLSLSLSLFTISTTKFMMKRTPIYLSVNIINISLMFIQVRILNGWIDEYKTICTFHHY